MFLRNFMATIISNMSKFKVFVVGDKIHVANWLADFILVDDIKSANIVLFTGGCDITPSLYGGYEQDDHTHNIDRDNFEIEMFQKVRKDQLCVGVCRGGQMLNVMCGGKMVQDCEGHKNTYHDIIRCFFNPFLSKRLYVNSRHHQQMSPYNLPKKTYKILYKNDNNNGILEPEIVLFNCKNKPKCLCLQFHPEDITDFKILMRNLNRLLIFVKNPFFCKIFFCM